LKRLRKSSRETPCGAAAHVTGRGRSLNWNTDPSANETIDAGLSVNDTQRS
jgi:hypothetical protein